MRKHHRHNIKAFVSSRRDDWRSQEDILQYVRAMGSIGLDPCAAPEEIYHFAKRNYSGPKGNGKDGLRRRWHGRGLVYSNPPYGRRLHHWVQKAVDSAPRLQGKDQILMLLPSRTDTVRVFHGLLLKHANALCFIKGRLVFDEIDGDKAMFPSLVAYFGQRSKAFNKIFSPLGKVWILES